MGLKAPSRLAIAGALAFALSVFAFTLYVWTSFGGPSPFEPRGYRFGLQFGPEATNLTTNAQARIAGVPVGRVVAVRRRPGRIDAIIELEERYAPVSRDARAVIRSKTLLGEAYVELAPGDRRAGPLPEGARLPRANVRTAQRVDQVLETFDPATREAFRRTVRGLSVALDDRGLDLNAALGHADPALEELERLTTLLDGQEPAVRGLVRDTGRTLEALGRRDRALQEVVTAGDDLLGATAARDAELTGTVRAVPRALAELRRTLAEAERTGDAAAPVLGRLRTVAPLLRPALEETAGLAPEAERLLVRLRPVVPLVRAALPPATRLVRAVRPLMGALDPAARELVPVVRLLGAYRREALAALTNLASATQGTSAPPRPDGTTLRQVRALPLITTEQVFGHAKRLPSSRANPYPRPGALEDLERDGLRAFHCRHLGNPQTLPVLGSTPPCVLQDPWPFLGRARSYPRLERFSPP